VSQNIEFITELRATPFPNEWYEANSEEHFWFQWRARAARILIDGIGIPAQQNLKVLDVGCGTGITCQQLAHHTQWTFDGVDLNLAALRRCDVGEGRILYYDILEERPDLADAYDVVILFDTLEHIEHTHVFLKAVFHHLKPGGVLLTTVPALMSLFGTYDRVAGHHRRYTKETLAREFAPFDVTVLDQRYWGFSMVPLLWVRRQRLRDHMSEDAVIRKGFVPPHPWVHALLRAVMTVEIHLIKRPPVGSSVMSAVRKNPNTR
jgi:SAM-dependent methyltransferase